MDEAIRRTTGLRPVRSVRSAANTVDAWLVVAGVLAFSMLGLAAWWVWSFTGAVDAQALGGL